MSVYAFFKFGCVRTSIVQSRYAAHLSPFRLNLPVCFAIDACGLVGAYLSCLRRGTRMPRLRNFDTEPPYPYRYEFRSDNRLESVANVHTAADLHVRPWFSNRADLESRGRRERY